MVTCTELRLYFHLPEDDSKKIAVREMNDKKCELILKNDFKQTFIIEISYIKILVKHT